MLRGTASAARPFAANEKSSVRSSQTSGAGRPKSIQTMSHFLLGGTAIEVFYYDADTLSLTM